MYRICKQWYLYCGTGDARILISSENDYDFQLVVSTASSLWEIPAEHCSGDALNPAGDLLREEITIRI
jgi:hypothetical protein